MELKIRDVVDRIGTGDAYAAGLLYGLLNYDDEKALNFANAACALKHTHVGDVNLVSVEEVLEVVKGIPVEELKDKRMEILKINKILKNGVWLILLFFVMSGCGKQNEIKEIKLGHGLDISHPVHKAMFYMSERLQEKSNGTMTIDIYPNQQLGSERECLELLQIGSLGMTKVSTGVLENFVPSLQVFGLPFLFRDREHLFAVLEGEIGEDFLNKSIDKRLKGLTFYDAGSRSFYSKTFVETPDDLNGLKLRGMESNTAINMVKQLGGSPTPIAWGELYTALQQGIVDGAENNLPSFYLSRHYVVCKYFVMDEHTTLPDELLISTVIWDGLSQQEQKWLKEAAMESSEYQKEVWREAELEALEEIKKAGVTVTIPNKDIYREKVQPMYEQFSKDPEMKRIIEGIRAIQ